jgi:hypothetical protein
MSDILEKEKQGNIIFISFGLQLKLINYVSYHRVHKMFAKTMTSANLRIFLTLLQSFLCIRWETTTRGLSLY